MPSYNSLRRRDSWPPTIVHIRPEPPVSENDPSSDSPPSNVDPITFFLTPSNSTTGSDLDLDLADPDYPFDIDDLSAGIEDPSTSKPAVREISPSKIQRAPLRDHDADPDLDNYIYDPDLDHALDHDLLDEDDDVDDAHFDFTMPLLSLRDFTSQSQSPSPSQSHAGRSNSRLDRHRIAEHSPALGLGLGLNFPQDSTYHLSASPPSPPGRGRAKFKLHPTPRRNMQSRSLSAHKRSPYSWREPSPELGRIEEEEEEVKVDGAREIIKESERGSRTGDERLSSSAPVMHSALKTSRAKATTETETPVKKVKKRVHWAD